MRGIPALAGAEDPDVLRHIRASRRMIRDHVPEFRSFMAGGFAHAILRDGTFYHYQTAGRRLRDWVARIVAGEPVASVDCGDDCVRPGLVYNEQDLRIVERALEMLSGPGAWNRACPAQADRYSIRCATVRAARDVTGRTLAGRADQPVAILTLV